MRPNRYMPPAMPGWGPITTPSAQRLGQPIWVKPVRELAILGVLAFAAAWLGLLPGLRGWLIVLLGRAVLDLLHNHRRELFRPATLKFAVVGALAAVIITTVPAAPKTRAPELKSPIKVEASQTDHLEQARKIWAEAWQRALAQGGADPNAKEGR